MVNDTDGVRFVQLMGAYCATKLSGITGNVLDIPEISINIRRCLKLTRLYFQQAVPIFWFVCDMLTDVVFVFDIVVQLRTGYLEQGLMVYDDKKLALHYIHSRDFVFDIISLIPLDLIQLKIGSNPLLRFSRFFKVSIMELNM